MKIGIFPPLELTPGKYNFKDSRLDQIDKITQAKKKTYVQLDLVGEAGLLEAEAILVLKDSLADVILKDLEFVETRLSRSGEEQEKLLLNKLKSILEKEELVFNAGLAEEEKKAISGFGLLSNRPVIAIAKEELDNLDNLLSRVIKESGLLSFFTSSERESRAWLVKQGTTAWEAAGCIHSDIQRGFIRAEVISFQDLINDGGILQAKTNNHLRLENKDHIVQDGDYIFFRFNK